MSSEYNAVQESIKIALDAADAATDVSSEFNKIKRENKKTGRVSQNDSSLYSNYICQFNGCRGGSVDFRVANLFQNSF